MDANISLLTQAAPGHKRGPSDVSVASSEEEKVPAAPSVLESVTEKPAEDQAGDKHPDQQLETNEVDKTDEEKVTEASEISGEDTVPSPDLVSQGPTEPKQDGQDEEVPAETGKPGPEAVLNAAVSAHVVMDGEETKEEPTEAEEEKEGDGVGQITEQEEKGSMKAEQQKEVVIEEVEDELEKKVQEEETQKEEPQQKTAEDQDSADGPDLSRNADSIDANIIDATSVDATPTTPIPTSTLSEQEPVGQLEEKHEAPEAETDVAAEDSGPAESISDTVVEAGDIAEDSEPCKNVPTKINEDENTSQDGVSVLESETDSESKVDQGSPATIKPDVESDSGSSSAADSNSLDLNLSISSFLSKTKEGTSISLQVAIYTSHTHYRYLAIMREILELFLSLKESKRQKKTLKKTRKFMVDGVEVSVTTSKIVTDNDAKNEEMRFLRWACLLSANRKAHT